MSPALPAPRFQPSASGRPFTGDRYNDLNSLASSGKLWSLIVYKEIDFPRSLYDYIDTKMPRQKIWLSGSTGFLMMLCNQYAPIFTYEGHYPPGGFIRNEFYQKETGGAINFC